MFLSSHGQILSDPNFWMFFIPAIFILLHIILLIIIIPQWLIDGYFDPKGRKEKKYSRLTAIANDLGLKNRTVKPQNNLNFFSWLVFQKKIRDYYLPYVKEIGEIEGDIWESRKKVKPDSIPRYFYGALFSKQPITDILCTKDSADPYIMIATQRISQGKNSVIYNRIIHCKSHTLDLPKCDIEPTHEWIDSISPTQNDINFVTDKEFSKKFDLTGDNQQKIRTLLSKSVRSIIVDNPEWKWKMENQSILLKYRINNSIVNDMSDIKPSLATLSLVYNKLNTGTIETLLSQEEIEKDTPDEIINKKLYNKRMITFGCVLGCGTFLLLLALFLLFGFFVRMNFALLFQGLFLGFIGIVLFQYSTSEWKRNKELKKEGKVKDI